MAQAKLNPNVPVVLGYQANEPVSVHACSRPGVVVLRIGRSCHELLRRNELRAFSHDLRFVDPLEQQPQHGEVVLDGGGGVPVLCPLHPERLDVPALEGIETLELVAHPLQFIQRSEEPLFPLLHRRIAHGLGHAVPRACSDAPPRAEQMHELVLPAANLLPVRFCSVGFHEDSDSTFRTPMPIRT